MMICNECIAKISIRYPRFQYTPQGQRKVKSCEVCGKVRCCSEYRAERKEHDNPAEELP